jgi:hypothetical protein
MRRGLAAISAIVAVGAGALSLGLSGCGDEGAAGNSAGEVFVSWGDITDSTTRSRGDFLEDMVAFAERAAQEEALFYADVFGGVPTKTTKWPVQVDFSEPIRGAGGNDVLERDAREDRAEALRPMFERLLATDAGAPGSPLLEVLAITAEFAQQHRGLVLHVALFTDGGLIMDGADVRDGLSAATRKRLVARWAPRLRGLAGAHVYVIGVGRGTNLSRTQLDSVRTLIEDLVRGAGGRLVVWGPRLSQTFNGS